MGRVFFRVVCGVTATFAAWFLIYALVLTRFQENGAQNRLYEKLRVELAETTAPLGGSIRPGSPVALISSAALGESNLVVVEGTAARDLASGPGLLADTPLPGQVGTSEIFGRSVTFGAPFANVTSLRPGARLTVTTGQGVFVYQVVDAPYSVSSRRRVVKAGESGLTLVTSTSRGWRNGWAPNEAVYVDTVLVHGLVQPLTPGLPKRAGADSGPMQGDPQALLPLILWVVGLAAASAAAAWSWVRWGRRQTWLVGLPLVIGLLWGAADTLMQFLPNLI